MITIRLKNVLFRYDGMTDGEVKNINFRVKKRNVFFLQGEADARKQQSFV